MEPTLTPSDPADDPLDALLRTPPQPIPDNGFTERVCAALPPRPVRPRPAIRWLLLSGALLLGCLFSWVIWSGIDPSLTARLAEAARTWKLETWHALVLTVALCVWTLSREGREDAIAVR